MENLSENPETSSPEGLDVTASPAGRIVESFTDPERDPLQAELFENPPKISKGWLTLNQAPGLGLTLSDAAVKKFGERIV